MQGMHEALRILSGSATMSQRVLIAMIVAMVLVRLVVVVLIVVQ